MKKLLLYSGPATAPYGNDQVDPWIRVDNDASVNPDVISYVPPIPSSLAGPWDRIALIHGIEHCYPWDALALIADIHKILVPGGIAIFEQPNLTKCAEHASSKDAARVRFGLQGLFGDPSSVGMMHHWAYSPETLGALLRQHGFSRIAVKAALFHVPDRDFRIEATR